jgi:hypothetical protein
VTVVKSIPTSRDLVAGLQFAVGDRGFQRLGQALVGGPGQALGAFQPGG